VRLKNSLRRIYRKLRPGKRERILGVELVNICNLHCAYCFRDEDVLYGKAQPLDPARLFDLLDQAPESLKPIVVSFTGGEPTLHPRFGEIVRGVSDRKVRFKMVTNGWHFDRVSDDLAAARKRLMGISFSLDGATRSTHDSHPGAGSFSRIMKALALCEAHGLPFQFNVLLRRDTLGEMERIAVLAARLGARRINFGAMLPTSASAHQEWGLTRTQELEARREAAALSRILTIPVEVTFGLHDPAPGAHCPPLKGDAITLDYRGQLRLCGNLSSFRGAHHEGDVPQGAATLSLAEGWVRIAPIGRRSLEDRDRAIAHATGGGEQLDAILGSPCLSCLGHFDKLSPGMRAALSAHTEDPAS